MNELLTATKVADKFCHDVSRIRLVGLFEFQRTGDVVCTMHITE